MSIQTSQRLESDVQTEQATFDAFDSQDTFSLAIGAVADSDAETGVDRRVKRAITEFFHATPVNSTDYRVESGSGSGYVVDLYDPDEPECGCPDHATFCKHVWFIFLFVQPAFLTDRIFGLGTGR